jgi:hypothetical protein
MSICLVAIAVPALAAPAGAHAADLQRDRRKAHRLADQIGALDVRIEAAVQAYAQATAALAAIFALLLPGLLNAALTWPATAKAALAVGLAAPLGFCMGMPFPLGLSTYRGTTSPFIPWAWSVNGALSVVATPLATLLAVSLGYTVVFAASVGLYALAALLAPDRTAA